MQCQAIHKLFQRVTKSSFSFRPWHWPRGKTRRLKAEVASLAFLRGFKVHCVRREAEIWCPMSGEHYRVPPGAPCKGDPATEQEVWFPDPSPCTSPGEAAAATRERSFLICAVHEISWALPLCPSRPVVALLGTVTKVWFLANGLLPLLTPPKAACDAPLLHLPSTPKTPLVEIV